MRLFTLLLPLLLRKLHLVAADESQVPFPSSPEPPSTEPAHRIAIIGGGAAGSSAAYHLHKYANDSMYDLPIQVTLFESATRIGGRTTTINVFNDESLPVELGASIFVKANAILYNAAVEFGFDTRRAFSADKDTGSDYDLGIWDGTQFVFKQTASNGRWQGYWDVVKLLWKYGISPIRVQRLTQDMLARFLKVYKSPIFPFETLRDAVEKTELLHFMALTGAELMKDEGIAAEFSNDIIQASTRVNYAQNLNQIHGVESLVCMATDGAMAVEGGNWQIFDEMVRRSDVDTVMGSTVTQIIKDHKSGKYLLATAGDAAHSPAFFDTVILAAPYQYANINFEPALSHPPEEIDYVSLHVTLFTSPHLLSPTFFGLNDPSQVPSSVLTTLPSTSSNTNDPNKFFSVSTLRTIAPGKHSNQPQHLYKIFSSEPLKASFLAELYGFDFYPGKDDSIAAVGQEHISWYYYKNWHSYPYEIPRTTFQDIKLDGTQGSPRGIWYTSGIEGFISTMETSALMGANVAKLIIDELVSETCEPAEFYVHFGNQVKQRWDEDFEAYKRRIGTCGFCRFYPCSCPGTEHYMDSECVAYRAAVEARKTWRGGLSWRIRSFWCRIKSLADGQPCDHVI